MCLPSRKNRTFFGSPKQFPPSRWSPFRCFFLSIPPKNLSFFRFWPKVLLSAPIFEKCLFLSWRFLRPAFEFPVWLFLFSRQIWRYPAPNWRIQSVFSELRSQGFQSGCPNYPIVSEVPLFFLWSRFDLFPRRKTE